MKHIFPSRLLSSHLLTIMTVQQSYLEIVLLCAIALPFYSLLWEYTGTLFPIVIYLALISSLFSIVLLILMLRPLFLIQLFYSTPITILYSGFEWLAHPASRASSWAELDTLPLWCTLSSSYILLPNLIQVHFLAVNLRYRSF
jgi:hypothetical protein